MKNTITQSASLPSQSEMILKVILTSLIFFAWGSALFAQCYTNRATGRTTGNVPNGTINWASPNNCRASDDAYARVDLVVGETSKFLMIRDFQFNLPTNSTILGVMVEIEKKQDFVADVQDAEVRLLKNGLVAGTNHALPGIWTPFDAFYTYGNPADLWGETLTEADIESPDFGVLFSANRVGGPGIAPNDWEAYVDVIYVTVFYVDSTLCGTLPVRFGSVTAKANSMENISVDWTTHSETNNDYFSIERSSDGNSFEVVGTMNAMGNYTGTLDYQFTDASAPAGLLSYRIRQTDLDGRQSFSEIAVVQNDNRQTPALTVSPNPSVGRVHIESTGWEGMRNLQIINLSGQVQMEVDIASEEARLNRYVDIDHLPNGMYLLRVSGGGKSATQKVWLNREY